MKGYGLPLAVVVLLIGFFMCIINAIYARIEAKNPSTWNKQSMFTTTKAWLAYAMCIGVILFGIFLIAATDVMNGYSNAGKAQDSITELQMSTTDTDASQTQE